jgi:hypothetical protein
MLSSCNMMHCVSAVGRSPTVRAATRRTATLGCDKFGHQFPSKVLQHADL